MTVVTTHVRLNKKIQNVQLGKRIEPKELLGIEQSHCARCAWET